jgi:acetyl-CoA acetyltransferase
MDAAIIATGQSDYTRHPKPGQTVFTFMRDAVTAALDDAGMELSDIDGLAVASFSLEPDHAIDLAWRMGLSLKWLLQDTNGGNSAMNMLGHAMRGVEAGAASNILVLAGDATGLIGYAKVANSYNSATLHHLAPLGHGGPNGVYALVTSRQMKKHDLEKADYGQIVVAQRRWAALNPYAVYRTPLSLEEYLSAPPVADPLVRYDCVPVVAGAQALIVSTPDRSPKGRSPVRIRALMQSFNYDNQEGDGTKTGISSFVGEFWDKAGIGPEEVDVSAIYDDYPAMVVAQLYDLGMIPCGDVKAFLNREIGENNMPVNTGGGMLSAGQPGNAGGLSGVTEVVRQLHGRAGDRQIKVARFGLVTGYGMTLYRYGGTASAAILEAEV